MNQEDFDKLRKKLSGLIAQLSEALDHATAQALLENPSMTRESMEDAVTEFAIGALASRHAHRERSVVLCKVEQVLDELSKQ